MKKILVKKLAVISGLCFLLLAFGTAVCGFSDPDTITAMIRQSRYYNGIQAMIEKLKIEENITIDVQVIPDMEFQNMLRMKLNSGEAPDLIDYNIPAIYDIVDPARNFADLSGEEWVGSLLFPENVTCKSDGKIYGFPFLGVPGVHGFIYNREVFAQAGADVPQTWEELYAVCEKFLTAGITPIYMPRDSWAVQVMMSDNFARILGVDAQEYANRLKSGEARWTDRPGFAAVIDKYLELYRKGYVNQDFATASYDDAVSAVANGKAAMHFNGDFFAASVMEKNPDADIGMFVLSMNGGEDVATANMSSPGFVVYKNTRSMELVRKVLSLWATPEYMSLYFKDRPGFPAFKGIDGGTVPSYLTEINEKYIEKNRVIPEWNYYVMDLNALFESTLYIYYTEAPTRDNMDGADILEKFQKDFEQYRKDQGNSG